MKKQPGAATVAGAAGPGHDAEATWAAEPVPHAVPLDAASPLDAPAPLDVTPPDAAPPDPAPLDPAGLAAAAPDAGRLTDEQLNQQISDAVSELIKRAHEVGQGIATEFGLTGSDAIALFKLESPMTMKDLGQRMGCDPSFVTTIADALERQGLARREPSLRDRRSKNIVLTPEGVSIRDRICAELTARAPWCTALDTGERRCLLRMIRKMLRPAHGR